MMAGSHLFYRAHLECEPSRGTRLRKQNHKGSACTTVERTPASPEAGKRHAAMRRSELLECDLSLLLNRKPQSAFKNAYEPIASCFPYASSFAGAMVSDCASQVCVRASSWHTAASHWEEAMHLPKHVEGMHNSHATSPSLMPLTRALNPKVLCQCAFFFAFTNGYSEDRGAGTANRLLALARWFCLHRLVP
jgi:hypothetical protein